MDGMRSAGGIRAKESRERNRWEMVSGRRKRTECIGIQRSSGFFFFDESFNDKLK